MISDDEELKSTQALLVKMKLSLEAHVAEHGHSAPGEMAYLIASGLKEQIADLEHDIEAYRSLKANQSVRLRCLAELGELLVAKRTYLQIPQRELASTIGVRQQQISRDEAKEYANVSTERLDKVIAALGVKFHVEMPGI